MKWFFWLFVEGVRDEVEIRFIKSLFGSNSRCDVSTANSFSLIECRLYVYIFYRHFRFQPASAPARLLMKRTVPES